MIKAVIGAEKDGKTNHILLLGLSHINLDKLREGMPIHIGETEMSDLAMPGVEIIIFADETEDKMQAEIEKRFTITNRVTRQ